jgi:hypothetical protein
VARVRFLSADRRLGPADHQRKVTGPCDFEISGDILATTAQELRPDDVLAVSHALAFGKFHARSRVAAFLAGRGVTVDVSGEVLDPATTKALARLHELAKAPTGHGSEKQRKLPGPAPKYPKATGEKLDLIKELWAGVLTNDEVAEHYGLVMRCPPPSRSWLVTELGLGKRPANPDRRRKPRSDKGKTKKGDLG